MSTNVCPGSQKEAVPAFDHEMEMGTCPTCRRMVEYHQWVESAKDGKLISHCEIMTHYTFSKEPT